MLFWSIAYILEKIKSKFRSTFCFIQWDRLADVIHEGMYSHYYSCFSTFYVLNFINLMFLRIHLASNVMTCLIIASGLLLNVKVFCEYIETNIFKFAAHFKHFGRESMRK